MSNWLLQLAVIVLAGVVVGRAALTAYDGAVELARMLRRRESDRG